jgi:hypothetical protein
MQVPARRGGDFITTTISIRLPLVNVHESMGNDQEFFHKMKIATKGESFP